MSVILLLLDAGGSGPRSGGKGLASWWKKHSGLALGFLASLVGSGVGYAAASAMPPGSGFATLFLGPFLVFLGSGLGSIGAALASGRRSTNVAVAAGVLATCIFLGGVSLMSSLPASSSAEDGDSLWSDYGPIMAAAAAFVGVGTAWWTTSPPPPPSEGQRVGSTGAETATGADTEGAAALRSAYELMAAPTLDNEALIDMTRRRLRELDALARGSSALAADGRRVALKLKNFIGNEFLNRAERALVSAQNNERRGGRQAFQAAKLAERLAQHALEVADLDRDHATLLRANQYLQGARMLMTRGAEPQALDEEIAALAREVAKFVQSESASATSRSRQDILLMRLTALQGLARVANRADVTEHADALLRQLGAATAASSAAPASVSKGEIETFLTRLSDGMTVIRPLQGGGFGLTYLCEEGPPMRRKVVAKTLRQEWLASDSVRRAFEAEASVEGQFQNENVPRVLYYKKIAGRPFKVMEYVSGGSLRDQIATWRQQGLTCDNLRVTRIMRDVVDVLVDFQQHTRGGVHRDLKPENILLDESGRAKVTDFGLAHVPRPLSESPFKAGAPLGTLYYMSPEQARGEAVVTPASDVYAIGVMLHELFTGVYPYGVQEGSTKTSWRDVIRRGELTIRDDALPPPARDLVRRCLSHRPEDRPDLHELRQELERLERQLLHLNLEKSMWSGAGVSTDSFYSLSIAEPSVEEDPSHAPSPREALL